MKQVFGMAAEIIQGTNLLIFDDQANLYKTAATTLAQDCQTAVAERGRFLLVISGGQTPRPLFQLLADPPLRDTLPWSKTHVFWADERLVPPTHEASNYGQASSQWLEHVPIPFNQIYPIDGTLTLEQAALDYANRLGEIADYPASWPRFDLIVLGIGSDGHTASLFPGAVHPVPKSRATLGVPAGYGNPPVARVTLTPSVMNDARHIMFLVTGTGKAAALAHTLDPRGAATQLPARRIRPKDGQLTWFVDKEAAARLSQKGAATLASADES